MMEGILIALGILFLIINGYMRKQINCERQKSTEDLSQKINYLYDRQKSTENVAQKIDYLYNAVKDNNREIVYESEKFQENHKKNDKNFGFKKATYDNSNRKKSQSKDFPFKLIK